MERRKIAAIMFTDMVGYSRKVHENEQDALALLSEHNRLLIDCILKHHGSVIKTIGDAFLADFDSAYNAVSAAVEIQNVLVEANRTADANRRMEVRIGIHSGDVIYREQDVFGDGVNIASRVEGIAGANQVFVSAEVYSNVRGKIPHEFRDLGEQSLKNISHPVRVYEVMWSEELSGKEAPKSNASTKSRRRAVVGVAAAALILLAAGAVRLWPLGGPAEVQAKPRLAVVGFSDETGDEHLARAHIDKIIGDAVVQKFYEMPSIQLVSPLRIMRELRRMGVDAAQLALDPGLVEEVANSADSRLVVSGRLSKLGDAYILAANLDDVKEGILLASHRVEDSSDAEIVGSMIDSLCALLQNRIVDRFGGSRQQILGIGELTTNSLDAYSHFVTGVQLYQSGDLYPGIAELARATEIDTSFALAYSLTACAYSFAQEDSLSDVYFQKALRYRDRFSGISKESLIFRGNVAWFENDAEAAVREYTLITELYPDDREGFYYLALANHYLQHDLETAGLNYDRAIELSPGFFPIYRDKALIIRTQSGAEEAIGFLQGYLRDYPNRPGADFARRTIAEMRAI